MKKLAILMMLGIFGMGCASLQVKAPKDPIKMDITMRVDVYQHIEKDIDAIESIVTGDEKARAKETSFMDALMSTAYADTGLDPEVEKAALRRNDRYSQVVALLKSGAVGENGQGLLDIRKPGEADASFVNAENNDRMIIYSLVAKKNGVSVGDIQKIYAEKLQSQAPQGAWIEVPGSGWQQK